MRFIQTHFHVLQKSFLEPDLRNITVMHQFVKIVNMGKDRVPSKSYTCWFSDTRAGCHLKDFIGNANRIF